MAYSTCYYHSNKHLTAGLISFPQCAAGKRDGVSFLGGANRSSRHQDVVICFPLGVRAVVAEGRVH